MIYNYFNNKIRPKTDVKFKNIIAQGNFWEFHSYMKVHEIFEKKKNLENFLYGFLENEQISSKSVHDFLGGNLPI